MTDTATIGAAIITRDDLVHLQDLLEQLAHLDQVVVVDTGSKDGTAKFVRELGPPFELHEFEWRPRPDGYGPDDWGFCAARNESFRLLRTSHAVWLDSDDTVTLVMEGKPAKATAEETAQAFHSLVNRPEIDLWLLDYVYAVDEFGNPWAVLQKERIVKLDIGWRWRYPVHELIRPVNKTQKELHAGRARDLLITHRANDPQRSARRNSPMIRAWLHQLEAADAPDEDLARARFLVGRSLFGEGKFYKAARWMLSQYLAKHPNLTPEDKWDGWLDVAKNLANAKDLQGGQHAALQAIGVCPRFGEAYVILADLKLAAGGRPADVLKLLETAESCINEDHGVHTRNPSAMSFDISVLAAEAQLMLGRARQALSLADRAISLRPGDPRARKVWEAAAEASKRGLESPPPALAAPAVLTRSAASGPAPVFVVSSGRCGSTLVSNMLRLHPQVLSLSELIIMLMPGAFMGGSSPISGSQFWSLLSTPRKRMSLMFRQGIVFDEVLYRPGPGRRFTLDTGVPPILLTALPHLTDNPEALYDEIEQFVNAQGFYLIGRHYLRLFEWLRERFGRDIYVERSGSSMVHLAELLAHFPDARFVHMFRDGRECAISMSKHSPFRLALITQQLVKYTGVDPYNSDEPLSAEVPAELRKFMPDTFDRDAFWAYDVPLEEFGSSWTAQERRGIELLAQLPSDRVHLLRYETLIGNPKGELTRLMHFLGVGAEEDYLERAAALVRVKAPGWPQLPEDVRRRLDDACRMGMGMLYGSEVLQPA